MLAPFASLAYLGPETMMPMTSIAAAALGVVLMLWQRITGFFRSIFARLTGRSADVTMDAPPAPQGDPASGP